VSWGVGVMGCGCHGMRVSWVVDAAGNDITKGFSSAPLLGRFLLLLLLLFVLFRVVIVGGDDVCACVCVIGESADTLECSVLVCDYCVVICFECCNVLLGF